MVMRVKKRKWGRGGTRQAKALLWGNIASMKGHDNMSDKQYVCMLITCVGMAKNVLPCYD